RGPRRPDLFAVQPRWLPTATVGPVRVVVRTRPNESMYGPPHSTPGGLPMTTTTPTSTTRRPGGITVIVALAVIDAVFTIIGGIWVVLDHDEHDLLARSGFTSNGLLSAGVAAIVLGFIGLFVALALGRGSRLA